MPDERRNIITDVLAYLLLAFVLICIFFDVGFFLGLNPNIGAATLMGNLETLIALPILPMTTLAMVAFNRWSLEVYVVILFFLVFLVAAYPFRKIVGTGFARLPRVSINPAFQLLFSWLLLLLAFVLLLWWIKFPDISAGANGGTVLALGATLLIGVLVVHVAFLRTRQVFGSALSAIMAIWVFMLIPLQWGLLEGAGLQLRLPSDKAELAGGATVIGRAVAAVPTGVVFVEYRGPGQRATSVLGGEQIVRIGGLSKAEFEPIQSENQPVRPVGMASLLCKFAESWTRKIVKFCDPPKVVAAVTMSPEGQLVWLSAGDPRIAQAVSLEAVQAGLAAQPEEESEAPPVIPSQSY